MPDPREYAKLYLRSEIQRLQGELASLEGRRSVAAKAQPRRRRMSAAQRKAHGERMRAFWAARRATKSEEENLGKRKKTKRV